MNTFQKIFDFVSTQISWDYTFSGTDSQTTQIKTFINQAHKNILMLGNEWRNQWLYEFDSVLLQSNYDLPSDFLKLDYLRVENWNLVNYISPQDYIVYTSSVSSVWWLEYFSYSILENELVLYPIPWSVVSFQLYYQKIPSDLVDSTDEILILDWFQLLVAYKSLFFLYMQREEPNIADYYNNMYNQLFESYKVVCKKKNNSKLVKYTWISW